MYMDMDMDMYDVMAKVPYALSVSHVSITTSPAPPATRVGSPHVPRAAVLSCVNLVCRMSLSLSPAGGVRISYVSCAVSTASSGAGVPVFGLVRGRGRVNS